MGAPTLGHRSDPHEEAVLRFLFSFGRSFLALLNLVQDYLIPSPLRIMDVAYNGMVLGETVRTLAALQVADTLVHGALTAAEIGARLGGLHVERLKRLLLLAAENNVFEVDPSSRKAGELRFRNNRLSATLREDHPSTQRYAVLTLVGKQHFSGAWNELEWGIRTGGNLYKAAYGQEFFERLRGDPELENVYSRGMIGLDTTGAASIPLDFKWSAFSRFVDIGGAYGSYLALLMRSCPKAEGVLFDQPQVIERARALWKGNKGYQDIAERVSFVSGSFFEAATIPAATNGTAYIMRQILHDWPDAEALAILTSLREAMGTSKTAAKLLLVEAMPSPPGSTIRSDPLKRARRASDIHMLCVHDAKERDQQEMSGLLSKAGFKLEKVVETRSLFSVVDLLPFCP